MPSTWTNLANAANLKQRLFATKTQMTESVSAAQQPQEDEKKSGSVKPSDDRRRSRSASARSPDPPAKRSRTNTDKDAASAQAPTNTKMPDALDFPKAPDDAMKIVSWNVAGLRASLNKGAVRYIEAEDADIVCLQETKISENLSPPPFSKKQYPYQYWSHCTARKGYSGTCILSKHEAISVQYKIGDPELDKEGRYIILEFPEYYFIGCYVMNAGSNLDRLGPKQKHYVKLESFLKKLQEHKPIIWGGDLNVAHNPIDLARPDSNTKSAGFTPQERADFGRVLRELDLVDTFRDKYPTRSGMYTYFSYRFGCRSKNIGWRLDYFVVSRSLMDRVVDVEIRSEVYGASDHVPLVLTLKK